MEEQYFPEAWIRTLRMGPARGDSATPTAIEKFPDALRVQIVSPDQFVSEALCHALRSVRDVTVVGVARSTEEARARLDHQLPDVLIRDLGPPVEEPAPIMDRRRGRAETVPSLVVYTALNVDQLLQSRRAGTTGWIHRDYVFSDLPRAVRAIQGGAMWADPLAMAFIFRKLQVVGARDMPEGSAGGQDGIRPCFTRSEIEILEWFVHNDSDTPPTNAEIAVAVSRSPHTVKKGVSSILRKLGIQSRHQIQEALNRSGVLDDRFWY